MQTRENALHQWLKTIYPNAEYTITPLAGDASFRRYYRLHQAMSSHIIMDAPPDKLTLSPFVYIQNLLAEHGITTPKIFALDHELGFALLEDFGDRLLAEALAQDNPQPLYQSAIQILTHMQQHPSLENFELKTFDQPFMLQELTLFQDWFLQRYLGLTLEAEEQQLLQQTFDMLTAAIARQPKVLVHRDYHSRNIMLLQSQPSYKFGIIDFQDAMVGPFTYDLVSLLKDCYILLPHEQLINWLHYFYEHSTLSKQYTFAELQQAFDWCGLQRHLRILGTFCRLHLRDGKSNYLNDLPRTYNYVLSCIEAYPEFAIFKQWLAERVHPHFQKTLL
jgi:aminoglycoside/choline kinase family phosphotransferase